MKISITDEMKKYALRESKKRNSHIKHHFEVSHLNSTERDIVGFLGEFACCSLLGIDWKKNIRKDYLTIDTYDFVFNGLKCDVKTETVPDKYASKILTRSINDDKLYGRRLINKGQYNLLHKYDLIIFGLFIRERLDFWYPIGYLKTNYILHNYKWTYKRPDGGKYPFPATPVHTSKINDIKGIYNECSN